MQNIINVVCALLNAHVANPQCFSNPHLHIDKAFKQDYIGVDSDKIARKVEKSLESFLRVPLTISLLDGLPLFHVFHSEPL